MMQFSNSGSLSGSSTDLRLPEYFRRMVKPSQMDFDVALGQMMYLCRYPAKAFMDAKHRKLTKNHWSRDDPAFLVLLIGQILCLCIGYSVALCPALPTMGTCQAAFFRLVAYELLFKFLLVGLAISSALWYVSNRFLHGRGQMHEVRLPLEWQYAFDIHCNAYFTMVMLCGVVQLLFLPFLLKEHLHSARILSNFLYALAFSVYFYVTFRGYVELPFLEGQEYFLYPIFFIALCFVLSLVTTFNCTSYAINSWLSSDLA